MQASLSVGKCQELCGGDAAQTQRQAALVTRGGILLDDAPLSGAVDEGERSRNQLARAGCVFLIKKTAHVADLMPQLRFPLAIDHGPALRYPDAFQRGYCV